MRIRHLAALTTLLVGLVIVSAQSIVQKNPYTTWSSFGGTVDGMQYSALKQINKTNVSKLELAWTYLTPGRGRSPFSPLIADGVMYVMGDGPSGASAPAPPALLALDATTGKQIWSHPIVGGSPTGRGISYWESKDRSDRRLIFSVDSYLQEVNARTGVTINTFGNDGRVNLREGLGRDPKTMGQVQSGSPGHVFENLIILGSAPGEIYTDPPGDLRAYDVLTGKNVWTFPFGKNIHAARA